MKKRVAFVSYLYPVGVSAMTVNSMRMFAAKGYAVDVFVDKSTWDNSPVTFDEKSIQIHVFEDQGKSTSIFAKGFRHALRIINRLLTYKGIFCAVAPFNAALFVLSPRSAWFRKWLGAAARENEYDYIFPIESHALTCCHGIRSSKLVYYNMELLDWSDDKRVYRNKLFLKKLEHKMIEQLSGVVIQSPARAEIFCEINKYPRDRVNILPVTSMGSAIEEKTSFFREKFDIPAETKIVVYSGNFVPWAQCLEIIETVKGWPKDFCLVMHTWNKAALGGEYFRSMEKAATGLPVMFSTEFLEMSDLAPALSSADLGLLFYEKIDGNFTEILFSSNKLGEYLKAGLPVVCSDLVSLQEFVERKSIGAAISEFSELPSVLGRLGPELKIMRRNALECYEQDLRFESHFEKFFGSLMSAN